MPWWCYSSTLASTAASFPSSATSIFGFIISRCGARERIKPRPAPHQRTRIPENGGRRCGLRGGGVHQRLALFVCHTDCGAPLDEQLRDLRLRPKHCRLQRGVGLWRARVRVRAAFQQRHAVRHPTLGDRDVFFRHSPVVSTWNLSVIIISSDNNWLSRMLTEWSDPGLVGSLHVRAQRDQLHVGTIYAPCTHHVRTI